MARRVIVRTSYMPDSRYLLVLVEAYERDRNMASDVKAKLISYLRGAAQILMEAKAPLSS